VSLAVVNASNVHPYVFLYINLFDITPDEALLTNVIKQASVGCTKNDNASEL
jgi:hypothetical protein